MPRRVFFSFDYQRDLWRVNVVRNTGIIEGVSAAGFHDANVWQETTKKGDLSVKKLVEDALNGTAVTAVLIGAETAHRRYVSDEIEQSLARGNGIFGIRINTIKDQYGNTDRPGAVPGALVSIGAPVYDWEYGKLGDWVEEAIKKAKSPSRT
jgi:hypothetical protein